MISPLPASIQMVIAFARMMNIRASILPVFQ